MMKYLIVDDEHIAHDIIKGYCDMLPQMDFANSCYDAIEAMDYLRNNAVDLIFLDLNLPKLKGFDLIKTLQNPPKVIVTTAYSEHALEGYELNVVDYLLKPFSFERFVKAVNKVLDQIEQIQPKISTINSSHDTAPTIFLRADKKHIQVEVERILFLESAANYVKVFTEFETIMVRDKITNLIESFPEETFLQVHKSFAVALKHIHSVQGNRIFIGDHQVPIGKTYRENVDRILS